MALSSIVLTWIVALFCLSLLLPLIRFRSTFLKWLLRISLIGITIYLCYTYIEQSFYVEPYIPARNPIVYVTNYGSHYHSKGCQYLWNSSNPISLYSAVIDNYSSCSRCDPPQFSAAEHAAILNSISSKVPEFDTFLFSIEYILPGIIVAIIIIILWRTRFLDCLEDRGLHYIYQSIQYLCIFWGLFFLFAVIFAFMFVCTIAGAAILLFALLQQLLSPFIRLFRKPAKPQIIKISAVDHPADIHTKEPKGLDSPKTPAKPPESPSSEPTSVKPTTTSTALIWDSAPAYRVCHFMWTQSIIFCEHIHKKPSLLCKSYIWTAFFYSIAKHMRNQNLVDEIYSQFKLSAELFIEDDEDKAMSLHCLQSAYRQFRSTLNASGIDPRTQAGIAELWSITAKWAFPDIPSPEKELSAFTFKVSLVTNRTLEIYNMRPPLVHYYFDID